MAQEEDRISDLSDDLLHQICSYLDLVDVVRTSQLSSRWKDLWKSVSRILSFDGHTYSTIEFFLKFVYGFLSSPRTSSLWEVSTIKFTACPSFHQTTPHVLEKLVNYSISHKTEVLEIDCMWCEIEIEKGTYEGHPLRNIDSPSLKQLTLKRTWKALTNDHRFCWNLPALTTLELVYVKLDHDPMFCWNLPALTTLKLAYVNFEVSGRGCKDLFSGFPSLKHLALTECEFCLQDFSICSRGLVSLSILQVFRIHQFSFPSDLKFVVSAPKLSSFTYFGDQYPIGLSANDLGSLESVKIDFSYVADYSPWNRMRNAVKMLNIFSQVSKTADLELSSGVLYLLSQVPELLKSQPSPFLDLKRLKLVVGRKRKGRKSNLQTIPNEVYDYFLNSSPLVTVFNVIDGKDWN